MCQHAMTRGFAATVYNRTKAKAQPLLDQGAEQAGAVVAPAGDGRLVERAGQLRERDHGR